MSNEMIKSLEAQMDAVGIETTPSIKKVDGIFYDGRGYLFPDEDGVYHTISEAGINLRLISMGFAAKAADGDALSPLSRALLQIQDTQSVIFAGGLAGYKAGLHHIGAGQKILVTRGVAPVTPKGGEWPLLRSILNRMFKSDEHDQLPYFLGWLKVFLCSYHDSYEKGEIETALPGQAVVLAGPRDCGKTLLKLIITELLGGITGRPNQFMQGGTSFNADLALAPILEIDDEAAGRDPRNRQQLSARLKEMTVSGGCRLHPKGRTPIMVKLCQRVLVCVNDEPENLMVLPAMEESVKDKLMLFRVQPGKMPVRTNTNDERKAFWEALKYELPALLYYLMEEHVIPDDLRCHRFGVTHFHHPELMTALNELSPESRAMEVIDLLFREGKLTHGDGLRNVDLGEARLGYPPSLLEWVGTAAELERIVRNFTGDREATRLFRYSNSAGMLLRSLSSHYPGRVKSAKRTNGYQKWVLTPPCEGTSL